MSNPLKQHRVALVIHGGVDNAELQALHSCDRPICCNPAHLRWGTHADNVEDRIVRRRTRTGGKAGFNAPMAQITPAELKLIVELLPTHGNREIARQVSVSDSMISHIRVGTSWRDETAALGWVPPFDRRTLVIAELVEALEDCLGHCMLDWTSDDPRAVKARGAIGKARTRALPRTATLEQPLPAPRRRDGGM